MFHVVAIEVARKTIAEMVENGGKWISARFPSFPYYLRIHSSQNREYNKAKSII